MAVRINSVTITPVELKVGQSFFISINAEEPSWETLKTELSNWSKVRDDFITWENVKNFKKEGK